MLKRSFRLPRRYLTPNLRVLNGRHLIIIRRTYSNLDKFQVSHRPKAMTRQISVKVSMNSLTRSMLDIYKFSMLPHHTKHAPLLVRYINIISMRMRLTRVNRQVSPKRLTRIRLRSITRSRTMRRFSRTPTLRSFTALMKLNTGSRTHVIIRH